MERFGISIYTKGNVGFKPIDNTIPLSLKDQTRRRFLCYVHHVHGEKYLP